MADMTALDSPPKLAEGGSGAEIILPDPVIKSAAQLYDGCAVFLDPADSMLAKTAGASGNPMWIARGVSSSKFLGDGVKKAQLTVGPHVRLNSATSGETIPATLPLGWPVYAKDNQTASLTDGGGLYPLLGHFSGMTGDSTGLPIIWIGGGCPFAITELAVPVELAHGDLVDAAATQDFTLYTTPGPVVVLGPGAVRSLTVWSGGTVSAATLAIGVDADPDAIMDEIDIFTGAPAAPKVGVAGVLGFVGAPLAAGSVIKARIAATGDNVVNFSAGALVAGIRLKPGSR